MTEHRRRLFFALWPPREVALALAEVQHRAKVQRGGRAMETASLHCTLAYLGALTPAQIEIAKQVGAGVSAESFALSLDHLDHWRHNHIVWAGAKTAPQAVFELAAGISRQLAVMGLVIAHQPLTEPHVTLLRNAELALPQEPIELPEWRCRDFVLAGSQTNASGARYEILARWPLAGGGD